MSLFRSLKLNWLSPERIKKISFGEVLNHGMLDTRTLKAKPGGLFDPKIFGTAINFECYCGKYKGKKNLGQKCERCEVRVAHSNEQRWRMGRIELSTPVTNILFFKNLSSLISKILAVSASSLEEIIYFQSYIVLNKGFSDVIKQKEVIKEKEVNQSLIKLIFEDVIKKCEEQDGAEDQKEKGAENQINPKVISKAKRLLNSLNNTSKKAIFFFEDYLFFLEKHFDIKIKTGSEAFLQLLKDIDLNKELENAKKAKTSNKSNQSKIKFCHSLIKNDIKLEWMVMQSVLVTPCGLRPISKLKKQDSTNNKNILATTQINTLYRKLILANDSVKYYTQSKEGLFFGELVINNAKKRLQKALDYLLQGSMQKKNEVKGLVQYLSGKDGFLRHYSLGKRTNFSARTVITPSPELRLDQVMLPVEIGIVIFRPLIIHNLMSKRITFTIKESEELINKELTNVSTDANKSLVIKELNEICSEHLIMVNRAPTLHMRSTQAAYPKLTLDKTIGFHPLLTTAYNADFDGDESNVHPLLFTEEIYEGKKYLLNTNQILDPANSNVIALLKQDIILGLYILTRENKPEKIKFYNSLGDIWSEYESQMIKVSDLFIIPICLIEKEFSIEAKNKFVITTLGRIIFNQALPKEFPYFINELTRFNDLQDGYQIKTVSANEVNKSWEEFTPSEGWTKMEIFNFLNILSKIISNEEMVKSLDELKEIGFRYAKGISISPFELGILITKEERRKLVNQAEDKVKKIDEYYFNGLYSNKEHKEKKVEVWENCKENLKELALSSFKQKTETSLYKIWRSGSRLSTDNFVQIFAMRGYVTDYLGRRIDNPIVSSLWEGLSPFDVFTLSYGAIKGMIDTALRTAVAGYFTRRIVEAAREIIINSIDCETKKSILLSDDKVESLTDKVYSRYLAEEVKDINSKTIISAGTLLGLKEMKIIKQHNIKSLRVFSSLTCELVHGICQKCYGGDLSKSYHPMELGSAVGVIAGQSVGQPCTQLVLNTFHTGGTVDDEDIIIRGLPKLQQILDNVKPEKKAIIAKSSGFITFIDDKCIKQETEEKDNEKKEIVYVYNSKANKLIINENDYVSKGSAITTGMIDYNEYLDIMGRLECQQCVVRELKETYNDQGINIHLKHIEQLVKMMFSRVEVLDAGDSDDNLAGDLVGYNYIQEENKKLSREGKKEIEFKPIISSLKELASSSSSFLASASFQSALKSLVNYSLYNPIDYLYNPKASIIAGQISPIGTGFVELERYRAAQEKKKKY